MNVWTDEIFESLKTDWASGLSASQCQLKIYENFGVRLSRNAVLGKLYRMGIGRVEIPQARPSRRKSNGKHNSYADFNLERRLKAVDPGLPTEAPDLPPDVADNPVTLLELSDDTCRWPIGDPTDHDTFNFCGGQPHPGRVYCERHARLSHASRVP